jgi:hypothetical protein
MMWNSDVDIFLEKVRMGTRQVHRRAQTNEAESRSQAVEKRLGIIDLSPPHPPSPSLHSHSFTSTYNTTNGMEWEKRRYDLLQGNPSTHTICSPLLSPPLLHSSPLNLQSPSLATTTNKHIQRGYSLQSVKLRQLHSLSILQ